MSYKSDFRMVAEYFAKNHVNPDYKPSRQVIHHKKEFFELMAVFADDWRFLDYNMNNDTDNNKKIDDEKEKCAMSSFFY